MRMIKCDGKMRIIKCGWKNADEELRIKICG